MAELWRERKPDDHWGEPGRWAWLSVYHDEDGNGVLDDELPMVPVDGVLIEDFDAAVERAFLWLADLPPSVIAGRATGTGTMRRFIADLLLAAAGGEQ